jgi:hypothetical protein
MASAIAAMRRMTKSQTFEEAADVDDILENLVMKLPPVETWDAEFCLGVLVLG